MSLQITMSKSMAFQIQLPFAVPIPVPVVPRKTDPLIQCIIENKLKKLCKLIRGRDINGLYPSELWNDDVTPLTAAVICRNEEICSYLLKKWLIQTNPQQGTNSSTLCCFNTWSSTEYRGKITCSKS